MRRNPALEGLRGVAILWVMGYHLFTFAGIPPVLAAVPLLPALLRVGWVGVAIFFALSGYLITAQLQESRGRPHYFRSFLLKRAARILPAYALLLAATPLAARFWNPAHASAVFNPQIPFWSHCLFVQNWFMAARGYLGGDWLRVTWSLAVEVQYYLFALLLVFCVPRQKLGLALGAIAGFALAYRYRLFAQGADSVASLVVLPAARMDSFALGGLVALLGTGENAARNRRVAAVTFLAATLLFVGFARGWFGLLTYALTPAYESFLAVGAAALVATLTTETLWSRLFALRFLQAAGRISYFLYLFHVPVALLCYELLLRSPPDAGSGPGAAVAVLSAALTWLLGTASYTWLESPVMRWCRRSLENTTNPP